MCGLNWCSASSTSRSSPSKLHQICPRWFDPAQGSNSLSRAPGRAGTTFVRGQSFPPQASAFQPRASIQHGASLAGPLPWRPVTFTFQGTWQGRAVSTDQHGHARAFPAPSFAALASINQSAVMAGSLSQLVPRLSRPVLPRFARALPEHSIYAPGMCNTPVPAFSPPSRPSHSKTRNSAVSRTGVATRSIPSPEHCPAPRNLQSKPPF